MKFTKFLAELFIGAVVGLIFWYWQKSTSAEDGALEVLDRLAAAELRVRDLEARLRIAQKSNLNSEQPEVLAGLSDLWGLETPKQEAPKEQQDNNEDGKIAGNNSEERAKDDLKLINGIGPTYERRLNEAGIYTFEDLAQQSSDQLRKITDLKSWHSADPQQWIDESRNRI